MRPGPVEGQPGGDCRERHARPVDRAARPFLGSLDFQKVVFSGFFVDETGFDQLVVDMTRFQAKSSSQPLLSPNHRAESRMTGFRMRTLHLIADVLLMASVYPALATLPKLTYTGESYNASDWSEPANWSGPIPEESLPESAAVQVHQGKEIIECSTSSSILLTFTGIRNPRIAPNGSFHVVFNGKKNAENTADLLVEMRGRVRVGSLEVCPPPGTKAVLRLEPTGSLNVGSTGAHATLVRVCARGKLLLWGKTNLYTPTDNARVEIEGNGVADEEGRLLVGAMMSAAPHHAEMIIQPKGRLDVVPSENVQVRSERMRI